MLYHVDCDTRFNTIHNLLASRFGDDLIINPASLLTKQSKHMLSLYATQVRFGMCFLYPSIAECPIGVQICFDTIAQTVDREQRKQIKRNPDNGSSTSRTHRKS